MCRCCSDGLWPAVGAAPSLLLRVGDQLHWTPEPAASTGLSAAEAEREDMPPPAEVSVAAAGSGFTHSVPAGGGMERSDFARPYKALSSF